MDGVYTTDPRVVPEAQRLKKITFEEMLEMASLGSKVLQIRSVEFAGKYAVRLRVLSSLTPPELPIEEEAVSGTLITIEENSDMEQALVAGIAFNRDEAKVTILGVPDRPGIAYQILDPIADANIEVDVIVQNVGHDGTTDLSFTPSKRLKKTLDIMTNVRHIGAREVLATASLQGRLVGVGMLNVGGASKMFRALAEAGTIYNISRPKSRSTVVIDASTWSSQCGSCTVLIWINRSKAPLPGPLLREEREKRGKAKGREKVKGESKGERTVRRARCSVLCAEEQDRDSRSGWTAKTRAQCACLPRPLRERAGERGMVWYPSIQDTTETTSSTDLRGEGDRVPYAPRAH